jgi:nucleoside-diphosphate-sugar epimerase
MILLTGCAGFIGHFVGKKLLEQGYKDKSIKEGFLCWRF